MIICSAGTCLEGALSPVQSGLDVRGSVQSRFDVSGHEWSIWMYFYNTCFVLVWEGFNINGLFKATSLNAAFSMAAEIIKLVSNKNREEKLDELVWLESVSSEEFLINLINNNIDKVVRPEKDTLLHAFIREFCEFYVNNEFYNFEDDIFDSSEYGRLYNLLDKFEVIIEDNDLELEDWEQRIASVVDKAENEFEKENPSIKSLEEEVQKIIDDMRKMTLELIINVTENVFFLLFSNKKFLFDFNLMISEYIKPENLTKDIFDQYHHINRCTYIPKWLENGIFYRDRGTCQNCGDDLSNSYKIRETGYLHFDHIVPLEKSGTNDSTNFQLLCCKCNLIKNDKLELLNYKYQMYWK